MLAHAGSCELELQLVSEQVASPFWAALPPTNALRNMALELAKTEVNSAFLQISLQALLLISLLVPCRKIPTKDRLEQACPALQYHSPPMKA